MVSTLDSESSDRGSNPREASLIDFELPTNIMESTAHDDMLNRLGTSS